MNDPTAIPPIDPSIAGAPAPDAPWVPPFLAQYQQPQDQAPPPSAPPPDEIQMPDDFVGNGPAPAPAPAPQQGAPFPLPDAVTSAAPVDPHLQYLAAINGPPTVEPIQTPNEYAVARANNAALPLEQRAQALDESTLSPMQRADVLSKLPPEQVNALALQEQAAKLHEQSARDLAAAVANDEAQRRNAQVYATAIQRANEQTNSIAQNAAALANTKIITPSGVPFTAFSILGGALGGIAQKGAGLSSNTFIDGLKSGIEQNVAIQRAQIENGWKGIDARKNLVAEQYQRTGDLYRAQQVAIVAHYDSAIKQAQLIAQDFDPNGTTALAIAQQTQQIQAQRAATLQKTNDDYIKNHVELMKAQNEADTLKQTIKHQNDETAIARGHLGIDYSENARKQKEFDQENALVSPEQVRLENPGLPEQAYPKAPIPRKQVKTQIEAFTKGQELQGKATENAQKEASGQVLDGKGQPYMKDGKPVQINPEVAKDLNERIGGGQAYLTEMSEVKRMLASDPSTFDRDKWAELNSHLETAAASWTQLYGAKASSRELEAAKEVVGANYEGYAARIKDKGTGIAAIGAQIDSTKRNLNTQLKRRAGITGGADLVDTSNPPPTVETPEDKLTKVLSTNYAKVSPDTLDADDRAYVQVTKGKPDSPTITAGLANDHYSPELNRALAAGIAPAQLRALDALQAAARGSDSAAREKALDVLGAIVGANKNKEGNRASATGADANVRAAAKAIIDQSSTDSMTDTLNNAMPPEVVQ